MKFGENLMKNAIYLAILNEYIQKIYNNSKTYECRHKLISPCVAFLYDVDLNKVTGLIDIDSIYIDSPETVWDRFHDYLGISKKKFFEYYKGRRFAYLWHIKRAVEFKRPFEIKDPPHSFRYV